MSPPLLELRGLEKSFGSLRALGDVSFSVHEGEIFGLLGPNGAGKSTLLSIVCGLLAPDRGAMFLDGKPFAPDQRGQRAQVGLVPQELAIYQELTAKENLAFFGELYGLRGPTLRHRIDGILHAVGLVPHADQRVATFSGGMKRRLNLGVALVHRPRLLLLDEPTVGVDPQSRNHIFEEVRRLHATGITILYTSHYMEEVQALCQRIGILDGGKLVACDERDGLLKLLPGRLQFTLSTVDAGMVAQWQSWPGVQYSVDDAGRHALESNDVKKLLLRFAGWLNDNRLEPESLHVEEANLERVFLHLTGRALRD